MALTTQSSNKVWNKVNKALAGANPGIVDAFRGLKLWLSTQKGNPDLQFIPFSAEDIVTNNGKLASVGASTLYGVYFAGRRTSGTTAAFAAVHDASDNSATTTTVVTAKFNASGQAAALVSGVGWPLATDATISCATAVGGATESAAADAADGFIIVGA